MILNNLDLCGLLPSFLKDDKTAAALCNTLQPYFDTASKDSVRALLFMRIDTLDESFLDELAFEFHADLYDYSADIEEKRSVLKESVRIHKFAGTAYAVKRALASIYKDASLVEWFESEPPLQPYTFKVRVKAPPVADETGLQSLLKKITFVVMKSKNVRSHLAGITIFLPTEAHIYTAMHHTIATHITIAPYLLHDIDTTATAAAYAYTKCGMHITIYAKEEENASK